MTIQPEGEDLRKAVKWISEERQSDNPKSDGELVQEACLTFNLSPLDAEYLQRFIKNKL